MLYRRSPAVGVSDGDGSSRAAEDKRRSMRRQVSRPDSSLCWHFFPLPATDLGKTRTTLAPRVKLLKVRSDPQLLRYGNQQITRRFRPTS